MQNAAGKYQGQFFSELLVVVFMGAIAFTAHASGLTLLLFPELAALSHDVLTRPRGKWASQPWRLIITPTLTAILGLLITQHMPYGAISIVIVVVISLILIRCMRSTIAPAISAGVLPLVLGERSWMYPVAILLGISSLVALLLLWRKFGPRHVPPSPEQAQHSRVVDALEVLPHDRFWSLTLLALVLVLGIAAQLTGLRFLLFPPLIVMAYELFGHPEIPGWMKRPALFPLVCLLTASIGLAVHSSIHANVVAVPLTVLCSIVILRLFSVHMPPALAVGLLPFVMDEPDYRFALSVAAGTIVLTCYFLAYSRLRHFRGGSTSKESQV